jgi:hypothetical protein
MLSKDKAKELVDKYHLTIQEFIYTYSVATAKQCALICVDEIIKQDSTYDPSANDVEYWQEVKNEINKL